MAQRIDVAKVAEAVAAGESLPAIAARLGIPERTVRRRASGHEVQAAVRGLRAVMLAEAAGRTLALTGRAADTLGELLTGSNPPLVRLAASRSVLTIAKSLVETVELSERVAAIEARLDKQGAQAT